MKVVTRLVCWITAIMLTNTLICVIIVIGGASACVGAALGLNGGSYRANHPRSRRHKYEKSGQRMGIKRSLWYKYSDDSTGSTWDSYSASYSDENTGFTSYEIEDDDDTGRVLLSEEELMMPPTEEDRLLMLQDIAKSVRDSVQDGVEIWPNKTLIYRMDESISVTDQQIISRAMTLIKYDTCIEFRKATDQDESYVLITRTNGSSCISDIGKKGGVQILNLGRDLDSDCMRVNVVTHELIHAIGFDHEQSRSDRDQFVLLVNDNIDKDEKYNFEINHGQPLLTPYDFQSIMHYTSYDFTIKNGQRTLERLDGSSYELGGEELTELDMKKINLMYGCPPEIYMTSSNYYKE